MEHIKTFLKGVLIVFFLIVFVIALFWLFSIEVVMLFTIIVGILLGIYAIGVLWETR